MARDSGGSFSVTTKVVQDGDCYAVYDEVSYDADSPPSLVCRFRGNLEECRDYAVRLTAYWKERLSVPPAVEPVPRPASTPPVQIEGLGTIHHARRRRIPGSGQLTPAPETRREHRTRFRD